MAQRLMYGQCWFLCSLTSRAAPTVLFDIVCHVRPIAAFSEDLQSALGILMSFFVVSVLQDCCLLVVGNYNNGDCVSVLNHLPFQNIILDDELAKLAEKFEGTRRIGLPVTSRWSWLFFTQSKV